MVTLDGVSEWAQQLAEPGDDTLELMDADGKQYSNIDQAEPGDDTLELMDADGERYSNIDQVRGHGRLSSAFYNGLLNIKDINQKDMSTIPNSMETSDLSTAKEMH